MNSRRSNADGCLDFELQRMRIEVMRSRWEKHRWRYVSSLSVSFFLLSFFFVYDRSYLDSALDLLDQQFKPFVPTNDLVDNDSIVPTPSLPPRPSLQPALAFSPVASVSGPSVEDSTLPARQSLPPGPSLQPASAVSPVASAPSFKDSTLLSLPHDHIPTVSSDLPPDSTPSSSPYLSPLFSTSVAPVPLAFHSAESTTTTISSLPPGSAIPPDSSRPSDSALPPVSSQIPEDITRSAFDQLVEVPDDCDIYDGKWVYDETYPLYDICNFAEREFQCHLNGRLDRSYQKWRWQPHGCDIPRFDAKDMLRRLTGKRVVIVGDSMSRTQWESLSCLLLQGVENKSSVEMIHGPIGRRKGHMGATFHDHNLTVDYFRSQWLVYADKEIPKGSPGRVKGTMKLKQVDMAVAKNFADADVLVINSGHWWTKRKTYDVGMFFQIEKKLMANLKVIDAYGTAMKTATSWVNENVNFDRTEVFFRSIESTHWEALMATQPYSTIEYKLGDPRFKVLKDIVGKMQPAVSLLNITFMSAYRPDGHVFNYTGNKMIDAAHWCVPGVPDTWNELLFGSLLRRGRGIWGPKKSADP